MWTWATRCPAEDSWRDVPPDDVVLGDAVTAAGDPVDRVSCRYGSPCALLSLPQGDLQRSQPDGGSGSSRGQGATWRSARWECPPVRRRAVSGDHLTLRRPGNAWAAEDGLPEARVPGGEPEPGAVEPADDGSGGGAPGRGRARPNRWRRLRAEDRRLAILACTPGPLALEVTLTATLLRRAF
jgi:hypothetical protein